MRRRLTRRARSRGARRLLADLGEMERKLERADKTADQNEKVEKNWLVSASEKQRIARRLLSLAGALMGGETPGVPDGTGPHGRRNRKKDNPCPFEDEEK